MKVCMYVCMSGGLPPDLHNYFNMIQINVVERYQQVYFLVNKLAGT